MRSNPQISHGVPVNCLASRKMLESAKRSFSVNILTQTVVKSTPRSLRIHRGEASAPPACSPRLIPCFIGWRLEERISPPRCSQKREQLRSKRQLFGGAEEEPTTATPLWLGEGFLYPRRAET